MASHCKLNRQNKHTKHLCLPHQEAFCPTSGLNCFGCDSEKMDKMDNDGLYGRGVLVWQDEALVLPINVSRRTKGLFVHPVHPLRQPQPRATVLPTGTHAIICAKRRHQAPLLAAPRGFCSLKGFCSTKQHLSPHQGHFVRQVRLV